MLAETMMMTGHHETQVTFIGLLPDRGQCRVYRSRPRSMTAPRGRAELGIRLEPRAVPRSCRHAPPRASRDERREFPRGIGLEVRDGGDADGEAGEVEHSPRSERLSSRRPLDGSPRCSSLFRHSNRGCLN
jgi:hypothetical protein